jgi:hypothetical protein
MSQKINKGNYETRDYFAAIELIKQPDQEISDLFAYGQEICAKEVGEYYKRIKAQIANPKAAEKLGALIKDNAQIYLNMLSAKTEKELRSYEESINDVEDKKEQQILSSAYNDLLLRFKKTDD